MSHAEPSKEWTELRDAWVLHMQEMIEVIRELCPEMLDEEESHGMEIIDWYNTNRLACNHCGVNLAEMPLEANLWPHFTGGCVTVDPDPPKGMVHSRRWWTLLRKLFAPQK